MACTGCSPEGCGDKGHCATGSCNKMNTYDWISTMELSDPLEFNLVEVSFKNGANKDFYINEHIGQYATGDTVLVEAATGYDVGKISLMGELVRMQLKKKSIPVERITTKIIRKANERDLEKLNDLRNIENASLVRARSIAYTMGLDMKLGDVQYQGDGRKATFFYTANGRVDFRELVKEYAREFKVKIEMRQIGSRQESARIGGIGTCGRELCCSTWLSDFRSVNTSAARYQNISINQTKLSGQCGRLKCCLNYELDSYMDAIKHFPVKADVLYTQKGKAILVKTDIFKGIMYYSYEDITMRGVFHPLPKDRVKEIMELNAKGIKPEDFSQFSVPSKVNAEEEIQFADVTGQIELPSRSKKNKKNKKPSPNQNLKSQPNQTKPNPYQNQPPQATSNAENKNQPAPKIQQNNQQKQNKPNPNRPNPNNPSAKAPNNSPEVQKPELQKSQAPNPVSDSGEKPAQADPNTQQGNPRPNFKNKKKFKNFKNKNQDNKSGNEQKDGNK